jgi:hypothetical protein
MEKISGIIPASPRVTKVDMTDSPGIRTTMPNADRGVGAMSAMAQSQPGTPAWKSKESRQAALVNEVSNNFFMKTKPEESETHEAHEAETPHHLQQPEGLFPKGSFIDRSA